MRSRTVAGCALLVTAFLLSSGALAADKFAAVPEKLQQFVNSNEIPGAVALVATKDRVLHLSAVGQSDLASGRKMKTNDIFWIASMSKPVTAVAVAMLADDGKLSFDDPVEKYLPEFRDLWVAGEQIGAAARAGEGRAADHAARLAHAHQRPRRISRDRSALDAGGDESRFSRASRCVFNPARAGVIRRREWTRSGTSWKS